MTDFQPTEYQDVIKRYHRKERFAHYAAVMLGLIVIALVGALTLLVLRLWK
jgi:cytochrome b subunit of formate dehydrogenase